MDVGLGLSGRHLGSLGCSISHHMRHHRIGLMCHKDRRSCCVELDSVDIVAEQVVELAVVVLVGRLVNGLRKLGI